MNFMRKSGWAFLAVVMLTYTLPNVAASEFAKREDGIHAQTWFKNLSFLELRDDLAEATKAGKGLVVIFEQKGCGSCKKLHEINFANKKLVKFISKNFDVLQINMYGSKEGTDMDGSAINERKYAERVLVQFTPTTLFYGKTGKEIFRIPGYLSPKVYRRAFEYVLDRGPQRKILFPRWSRDRARAEKAKGGS